MTKKRKCGQQRSSTVVTVNTNDRVTACRDKEAGGLQPLRVPEKEGAQRLTAPPPQVLTAPHHGYVTRATKRRREALEQPPPPQSGSQLELSSISTDSRQGLARADDGERPGGEQGHGPTDDGGLPPSRLGDYRWIAQQADKRRFVESITEIQPEENEATSGRAALSPAEERAVQRSDDDQAEGGLVSRPPEKGGHDDDEGLGPGDRRV